MIPQWWPICLVSKRTKITPGVYRVDIVLNQTIVDTRNVNFVEITPEKGIAACLTTESLDAMGVNTDAFPAFKQLDKQACVPLAEIIPDASVTFNVNKLRLEIFSTANRHWICPYISRHLLSLNPLQARCRRYSRGER